MKSIAPSINLVESLLWDFNINNISFSFHKKNTIECLNKSITFKHKRHLESLLSSKSFNGLPMLDCLIGFKGLNHLRYQSFDHGVL